MKYSVHSLQDKKTGDFYHAVFEEATQQVIQFHYFLDDAQAQAKFMENGGSFRGITPAFILKEIIYKKHKKDLDTAVSALLSA